MKKYAVAAAFMLALVATAPASAIEVVDNPQAAAAQMDSHPQMSAMDMAAMPAPQMSELPEPEVFAMMLLGLVLIGYRARRESGEKFR
ncbi:hypothetical protein CR152_12720 [Massilia violaceinigra]|uniref:PEP-CTERM protein-sorting domain-containing protein n=1 Tax=Massilia violaceinigra TaxID=2045208 RepID=A0A2D2DJX1_9BURK|nr:PEP-CTERM sorting domain-containing protein [Massilia violaceinigra]ATQ75280.1 hypothetical protein CR152_12720 [Massilia violaceinigra]